MSLYHLHDSMEDFGAWKAKLCEAVERFRKYLERNGLYDQSAEAVFDSVAEDLENDKVTVAFVAEFSRGKTELINALFFGDLGVRLLPSMPGRTTMCPVEIGYDKSVGNQIRLLPIETRLDPRPLSDLKKDESAWEIVTLDTDSPLQMQEAMTVLVKSTRVPLEEAERMGLYNPDVNPADEEGRVEIPRWRHAIVNLPNKLLEQGLVILDTPGLNALGSEPELTLSMLSSAHVVMFLLGADTGVTKSDMDVWRNHIRVARRRDMDNVVVVVNKIDTICDDTLSEDVIQKILNQQVRDIVRILNIREDMVFPISAKKALLGNFRDSYGDIQESRIEPLERFLSEKLIANRKEFVFRAISGNVEHLVHNTLDLVYAEINSIRMQIEELKKAEYKSEVMLESLVEETQGHQAKYARNVEHFQGVREQYIQMANQAIEHIAPQVVDGIIRRHTVSMESSLTTVGMKEEMRMVFQSLEKVVKQSESAIRGVERFVAETYDFFAKQDDFFKGIKPPALSIEGYLENLKTIFEEGEAFRSSMTSTLLEQHIAVRRLYTSVLSKARRLLASMYKDSVKWSTIAMAPLINRFKEQKNIIENKLAVLKKVSDSKGETDAELAALHERLAPLEENLKELNEIEEMLSIGDDRFSVGDETVKRAEERA